MGPARILAVSLAATSAAARAPTERGPAALLPVWAARLAGFAALAFLGVSQWQRMVAGIPSGRPVLWVVLAVAAAAAVLVCERLPERPRPYAMIGAALAGLLAAYLSAGLELGLLRPRRIDELGSGLVSGAQALSTVRLPYEGTDPWPSLVLQLLGSGLVMIAGLLALWPRGNGTRGYPFLSLAALLVLTASPVVSMGGTRPLLLGMTLTVLTVCFLWLERLPLRPGLGVAALVGIALAGALPIASAADRGQPWFDYQTFAEGLGPKDPVRFDWGHGDYGPITWGRTGAEVVRVKARRPSYWKVRTLDEFDGNGWTTGGYDRASDDPTLDLPADWRDRTGYEDTIQVSVQRMRGTDVVGAGTTLAVENESRRIEPGVAPGQWQSIGELRTGDSYTAHVYVPKPTTDQLAAVQPSPVTEHKEDLRVRVHLRDLTPAEADALPADVPRSSIDGSPPESATIEFPPFGLDGGSPIADYRTYGLEGDGDTALRLSDLGRTYALAQRLKATTTTPYDYALAVNDYLRDGFTYTEKPPVPDPGVEPIESFLFDTRPATASTSPRAWRCCCAWAGSRRASRPASRQAATPSASRHGSSATPTRTPGWRRGSRATAGSRSTRRRRTRRRARRSPRSPRRRRRRTPPATWGPIRTRAATRRPTGALRARGRSCSTSCAEATARRRRRTTALRRARACRCGR
jgi:hypothetical protein